MRWRRRRGPRVAAAKKARPVTPLIQQTAARLTGVSASSLQLARFILQHGSAARREQRAEGPRTAWILQLGRKERDGSFRNFGDKVRGLRLDVEDLQVTFDSLQGDTFRFGWDAPFRRHGAAVLLSDFPHYDNPYSRTELQAETMDIQFQDLLLRLYLK